MTETELTKIVQHHGKRLNISQIAFIQLIPCIETNCLYMWLILTYIVQMGNTLNQFFHTYPNDTIFLQCIFCKSVVAYKNLVARGYEFSGSQKFAPTNAMAYGDVVNDQEDILSSFVSQCLVLNPMAFTPTDILFSAYNAFCNGQGIQDYNTFSKNLSNMLAGNAAVKSTRKRLGKDNKRGYEGICLK